MYSGIADPRRWSFPLVIKEQAEARGDEIAVAMTTGERIGYRELRNDAARVAGLFAAAGAFEDGGRMRVVGYDMTREAG